MNIKSILDVLSLDYEKILIADLDTYKYETYVNNSKDKATNNPSIAKWLIDFANSEDLFYRDRAKFLKFVDPNYVRKELSENRCIYLAYRRKMDNEYQLALMTMYRVDDTSKVIITVRVIEELKTLVQRSILYSVDIKTEFQEIFDREYSCNMLESLGLIGIEISDEALDEVESFIWYLFSFEDKIQLDENHYIIAIKNYTSEEFYLYVANLIKELSETPNVAVGWAWRDTTWTYESIFHELQTNLAANIPSC